jgi:hypothetical protein
MAVPLVIDLGSIKPKEAKRLKNGTGKKLEEVLQAAHAAGKGAGTHDAPIVVIYRKKSKKSKMRLPFPFSPF